MTLPPLAKASGSAHLRDREIVIRLFDAREPPTQLWVRLWPLLRWLLQGCPRLEAVEGPCRAAGPRASAASRVGGGPFGLADLLRAARARIRRKGGRRLEHASVVAADHIVR